MKVRNIVFLLLALAVFILLLFWSTGWVRLPFIRINPFEAIPSSTTLILDFKNLPQLEEDLEQTVFQEPFSKDFIVQKLHSDFGQVRKVFRKNADIQSIVKDQQILAAFQVGGAKQFDFLYVLQKPKGVFSENEIVESVQGKRPLYFSTFQGKKIHQWQARGGAEEDLVFCVFRNLLLIAPHSLLVEDAINQIKHPAKSILKETGFQGLTEQMQNGRLRMYVGLHNLPSSFSPFFENRFKGMLNSMEKAFSWVGFNVQFNEASIALDGLMAVPNKRRLLLNLSNKNSGDITDLATILPNNTAVFTWLNFEDWTAFYQSRNDLDEEFQFYFHPWLGKDFAYVITEPYTKGLEAEKFAVFRVADPDLARHYLEKYTEQKGELKNFDYQSFRIRQVLAGDLLKPIFGADINGIHNPYYTQLGDFLIFSNSRQSLEVWIDKYLVGQTLSREERFLLWANNESSPSNGLFYLDPSYATDLFLSFLKENYGKTLRPQLEPYLNFNQFAFSLRSANLKSSKSLSANFSYGEKKESQTTIMWKTTLTDTINKAPQVFYNPRRQAYEIFVQDQSNRVYLLNQGGDILWKRAIEEPLLSDMFTIDFYGNGHVQLLFNTANSIYLLDDEGKDAGTFPIPLKSKATNGVVVVDFQKRKEYAYFLACENGNVYGFSQQGRPLQGWNPQTGVGRVEMPIQHCVYNNKDFLMILDSRGRLSAFKRDGSRRFKSTKLNAIMTRPFGVDLSDDRLRMVGADERGKLYVMNSTGDLFHLNMLVGKNEGVRFCFANVLGDERKDYIAVSEKDLVVYAYSKNGNFEEHMNHRFKMTQDSVFEVQLPGYSQSMIGSLSKESEQINLLNGEGKLYPGFPLAGSTAFEIADLFGNGQRTLVVGNGRSVYVYKLF